MVMASAIRGTGACAAWPAVGGAISVFIEIVPARRGIAEMIRLVYTISGSIDFKHRRNIREFAIPAIRARPEALNGKNYLSL